ncbi:DUF4864 domain-containing protein [Roseovarius sp. SCSIO 43702]|uniref:DUF4864 domain-containing protein n=1 Tax=Roseovarius sp. SCSIO 43702 TaxID=2823043 RepID=UPI001C72BB69|nr:DUF4864 domain-containing protein [Roseovarius sp. SCSIO 43702]QYX55874.1 DUF4864 domain-containing protein [Roseovarius sp. SCSIO 43702]
MRPSLALTAFAASLITHDAQAQETDAQSVITAQIEAFQRDDFEQAFTHASPTIRRIFGTSENFGQMVRRGYPMVWRPDEVRFLGAEARGGATIQDVMIRDSEGRLHILEYEMIEGESGWKINGVRMKPATDGTA